MIESLWANASGYIAGSVSGFIEMIPWRYVITGLVIVLPPLIFFWSRQRGSAPAGRQAGTAPAPAKKDDKFRLESLAPVVMLALVLATIVTLAAAIGTRNPGLWMGFWILAAVTAVVSTAGGKWLGYTITYVALLGSLSLLIGLLVAAQTIPFFNKVQLP